MRRRNRIFMRRARDIFLQVPIILGAENRRRCQKSPAHQACNIDERDAREVFLSVCRTFLFLPIP